MTTVVYRDGILAADSLADWNGTPTTVYKLHSCARFLFAGSGSRVRVLELWEEFSAFAAANRQWRAEPIANQFRWSRWQHSDADPAPGAILVSREMKAAWMLERDRFLPRQLAGDYLATGSGTDYALGALAMGATAADAVRVACKFDIYSGGDIKSLAV